MKKSMILFLVLLHCFLLGACGQSGPLRIGGKPGTANGFESDAEPEIVIYEDEVQWEELWGFYTGRIAGYVKYTYGKNNNASGCVLLEIYDPHKNLLHSFAPKFPNSTLRFEGVSIVEESWYSQNDRNEYIIDPDDISRILAYEEYRNGVTTRLDLYGKNGQVVRTLTPSDPTNILRLDFTADEDPDYRLLRVTEGKDISSPQDLYQHVRFSYYTKDGDMLLDNWYTTELVEEKEYDWFTFITTRIEGKDEYGNVLYDYSLTDENHILEDYYSPLHGMFVVYEATPNYEWEQYFVEYREPQTKEVIFSARRVYQGDQFQYIEMSAFGGKVEAVAGPTVGTYSKLEFYDPDGVLQETVEATDPDGWLMVYGCTIEKVYIDIYDGSGAHVGYATYSPKDQD